MRRTTSPLAGPPAPEPAVLDLHGALRAPVRIASLELLRTPCGDLLRARSADGVEGIAFDAGRLADWWSALARNVVPVFEGRDARDLEALLDRVHYAGSNYKLAGLIFWSLVAHVELCLLDLLGRTAGKPVCELLGGARRSQVPVYLSSLRRDTTPEQEVERLGTRLAETGASAVKVKIGGRLGRNADAAPGRTRQLVALARKRLGDSVALYADANGSYDARAAIDVGRMLEAHGVGFFEEPCFWEDHDETRRVADALDLPVAGGEQETSLPRFRSMIQNAVVDVLQPDLHYNGGIVRSARVARLAARAGVALTPHCAVRGAGLAPVLHFAAALPAGALPLEYDASPASAPPWYSPVLEVRRGAIALPGGPGFGVAPDPEVLARAVALG